MNPSVASGSEGEQIRNCNDDKMGMCLVMGQTNLDRAVNSAVKRASIVSINSRIERQGETGTATIAARNLNLSARRKQACI